MIGDQTAMMWKVLCEEEKETMDVMMGKAMPVKTAAVSCSSDINIHQVSDTVCMYCMTCV